MKVCSNCGLDITYIDKKGVAHWYGHEGKFYCEKCDNKLFKNPKWHPITRKRLIGFMGKQRYVRKNPRVGTCSKCHKSIGDTYINSFGKEAIIKVTHMHHLEYHDDDPLKDTIELCCSCHSKIKTGPYFSRKKQ